MERMLLTDTFYMVTSRVKLQTPTERSAWEEAPKAAKAPACLVRSKSCSLWLVLQPCEKQAGLAPLRAAKG